MSEVFDKSKCQLNSLVKWESDERPAFIECACGGIHPITYYPGTITVPVEVSRIPNGWWYGPAQQSTETVKVKSLDDVPIWMQPRRPKRDKEYESFGNYRRAVPNNTRENSESWAFALEKNHIERNPCDPKQRRLVLNRLKRPQIGPREIIPLVKREPSREDIRRFIDRTSKTYNQAGLFHLMVGLGILY